MIETGRLRFAVGAGIALGLGVLAGHFQPPFHAALLVVLLYALTAPLLPLVERLLPDQVTSTRQVGRAMLAVARRRPMRRSMAFRPSGR